MTASPVKPIATIAQSSPPIHLKQILRTLPKECFQKQPLKAWTAVALSLLMVSLGIGAIACSPWFLLPFAWLFTGTAMTGLFVLAHDCGHRSFAKRRWVNDWVGHLLMLPLMYPFHSWRLLHDFHHKHTNKLNVDNAWHPFAPEFYDRINPLGRWGYRALRGRVWWVASIVHWIGLHFDLRNFAIKDRKKVAVSIATVAIFASLALPLVLVTVGVWGFVKFWLLPWLVFHFWMSTFTLVHHTDADIAFEPIDRWNAAQAQLSGTIHCNYPRWVEFLCHDISVHVPHHISTAIPSYHLWTAHRSLQRHWGDWMQPERRFSWSLMRQIVDRCHLYNRDAAYQSFADHHARR